MLFFLGVWKGVSIPDGAVDNHYRTFSFQLGGYYGSTSFLLDASDGAFLITAFRWAGDIYAYLTITQLTDNTDDTINDFSYSCNNGIFTVFFGKGTNINTSVKSFANITVTTGTSATPGDTAIQAQKVPCFLTRMEGNRRYLNCDIYISSSNKAYIQNNGTDIAEFPVTVLV